VNDLDSGIIFYHLVRDTVWLTQKQISSERDAAVLPPRHGVWGQSHSVTNDENLNEESKIERRKCREHEQGFARRLEADVREADPPSLTSMDRHPGNLKCLK
jgi:hypothetical protein